MVLFDWTTRRHDGVTLVTVRLTEIDSPVRVTVQNRLDGPIWPPRREGVPEAGWSETGFEGVVGPGSHALGYATPAPPTEPAATLEDVTPAPNTDAANESLDTAANVVRALGDPSPPADAVPAGGTYETTQSASRLDGVSGDSISTEATGHSGSPLTPPTASDTRSEPAADAPDGADRATAELPAAVGPWIAAMARRADCAETLAEAETLPAATAAVRDAGGLEAVRTLAADSSTDERQLRTLARRAQRLADRRAAATIPVATLETLG